MIFIESTDSIDFNLWCLLHEDDPRAANNELVQAKKNFQDAIKSVHIVNPAEVKIGS